ncbi:SDR family NAD(P)-dependent oxidoreductase [Chitinophaga rhizophila]|uniref:SDR family NAD(P)-dependent oxidoreductase n=1 Tax=Chitinophaga rhizophila TaxID=2866212 RepID=A0ABS7GKN6_9BACT|nr:SDR family NAD(P)-dependent oxidoreductase [Chitinophaga rhizophila]MBW8688278.1 SDR family NAD(P)-dependent oxidoreductase [Chitinophaga rhizophila]
MKEQNTTDQLQFLLQQLRDKKLSKTVALEMIRQLKQTGSYTRQTIKTPVVTLSPANGNGHTDTQEVLTLHEDDAIIMQIRNTLAEVMILHPNDIDIDQRFIDMGVDSIVGVEWVRLLNKAFGINIPATRLYDFPTITGLAGFIAAEMKERPAITQQPKPSPATDHLIIATDIETTLKNSLSEVLYLDTAQLDSNARFTDIGIDSIIGVEWVRTINRIYSLNLPATRLYDYPSIRELAAYLRTLKEQAPAPEKLQPPQPIIDRLPESYGVVLSGVQTLDEISIQPWHVPPPTEWEVTIQVKASAINFPDTMCIKGLYPTMPDYPFVPGFEAAGIITATGSSVTQWKAGDEVVVTGGQQLGCHASYVNVPVAGIVRKPATWSFEEACCMPVAFTTVYHAFELAALKPSERILIQTATGGCGLLALQLASLTGCELSGTSSRQEKLDILTALGVYAINYLDEQATNKRRTSDEQEVDVVLNMLSGEAIQKGLDILAAGGRYLELAVHGLKTSKALDFSRLLDNQVFYSIDMRRLGATDPERIAGYMAKLGKMAASGDLVPIVSRIYPVSQIAEALRYVESGAHIGKVVISHTATVMEDRTERMLKALKSQMQRRSFPDLFSNIPAAAPVQEEHIAIIGVSGQFPQSPTLEAFWDNLKEGRNCIREVGPERWSVENFYSPDPEAAGKTSSKWMGVLEDADKFDPLFFNISPAEAVLMDPQQRLFLENCWHSIENAGISPASLAGTRCGVFAGCAVGDYGVGSDQLTAQGLMGGASSILSARISYLLDLKGPSLAIETACSSTLVAIAAACDSLVLGRSDLALAGGVCVMAGPYMHIMTSKAGMLSPTGRCYSFDSRADGFVPGEGAGVFLLKRLSDAERDGDYIHGVIRAWGVNQDGKTNGITAPSVRSQQTLEQEVYEHFRVDPATITMLEAHGTGTPLGDPIEVEALSGAFRKYTRQTGFCALGAVKSNVGHLMNAAGAAGLMKILLSIKHKSIPPTIHFEQLNEHINLEDGPFYINTTLQPWTPPAGTRRRAAISAFGFSGTNAHLVIDEYSLPSKQVKPNILGSLFLLSARNEERLRAYAQELYQYVQSTDELTLPALAYTLQTGRDTMNSRLAVLATSKDQLLSGLQDYVADSPNPAYISAQVKKGREGFSGLGEDEDVQSLVHNWLKKRKLARVAELWVKGLAVEWDIFYGDDRPYRIPVPGYPFARERYWLNNEPLPAVQQPSYNVVGPVWKPAPVTANQVKVFDKHWVLLCGIQEDYIQWLKQQLPAVHVDVIQPHGEYIASSYSMHATMIFEQLQEFLQNKGHAQLLVQVIIADKPANRIYEGLTGLLKTAGLENPRVTGQVIVLPATVKEEILEVIDENAAVNDAFVRYQGQARLVQDWEPVTAQHVLPVWNAGGVYLLTGGLGGIALLFAREILQREPSATLILVGRSPLTAEKEGQLNSLQTQVGNVEYYQADCSQREAVAALFQHIIRKYGTLNGILHSAGQIKDNFIIRKTVEEFESVLSPKIHGVQYIDELSKELPLDWFICFGSVAGVSGNAGQADYAGANAFLDAYMHYRHTLMLAGQRSGISLCIDWPLWKDGGMKVDTATEQAMTKAGMPSLDTATGIAAFYQAMAADQPQVMVVGRTTTYRDTSTDVAVAVSTARKRIAVTLSADELKQTTLALLKELLSEHIQLPASAIDEDEAFESYGIDSIMINQLNQRLARIFGSISRTLFFEYQSLRTLADFLAIHYPDACHQWAGVSEEEVVVAPVARETKIAPDVTPNKRVPSSPAEREAIAIVGISGRYPQAANVHAFWDNLREGKDVITEIPADRWSLEGFWTPDIDEAIEQGKSYGKWGGFLQDHTAFDAAFFNISPREALSIDPQERLFLEVCWEALEDAGYTRKMLLEQYKQQVGVFAGITKTGFDLYGPALWAQGEKIFPHTSFSSVANRISYFLNIHGPSLPVDTMCSSSLTAIHEASEYLLRGDCTVAIAGGVNLYLHPSSFISLSAHRMLSIDGRSKSFGAGGDGFAPGEGVGAVVLKRLSDAEKDGDHIYALIRSTGINHGGKTNGYTVPNPGAQSSLIRATLDKAGIDARQISYVEAHGTGTALGDPIEVTGLTQAYEKDTLDKQYCALGAVKSNIGHLEAAAGIAGLTKIVLQLKHEQLAPSLYAGVANPNILFTTTPFAVQQELTAWKRPVLDIDGKQQEFPRIAGLSSFGAGGANAHIIVEEYSRKPKDLKIGDAVIVLSAHDADRLPLIAERLLTTLERERYTDRQLAAISWTLQTGREAMEERIAFTVSGMDELRQKLKAIAKEDHTGIHRGKASRRKQEAAAVPPKWISDRALDKIAAAWVVGADIQWELMYTHGTPTRISLPPYPFKKERYWLPALVTPVLQEIERLVPSSAPLLKVELGNITLQPLVTSGPHIPEVVTPVEIAPGSVTDVVSAVPIKREIGSETAPSLPAIQNILINTLADVLLMQPESVQSDKSFLDMGLDSIVGVEWMRTVNREFNINVPATRVYDYPTIEELTAFISDELNKAGHAVPAVAITEEPVKTAAPTEGFQQRNPVKRKGSSYGLVVSGVQTLDEVCMKEWDVSLPAAGEITIEVKASAVNFPDTLCVKGLYPTIPDYPFVPGFEVAGLVSVVGEGVTDVKVGDKVIATTGTQLGGHAGFVNVAAAHTVRMPGNWTFEEACSLPVVFSTVLYAFELGRLSPGEKVLIHTATGGCGLAALQLANLKGCEIYATAGKEHKLELLRQLGVKHVLSYKGDFDKEIREVTNGEGVQVVLNMLSGDAIQKGLRVLANGGRYLELAVHGLKTSARLDLSSLLANQSFYSIDLRRTGTGEQEQGKALLDSIVVMAEAGLIVPVVSRVYPVDRIQEALAYVDQGEHIGKVVISHVATEMHDLTTTCITRLKQQRNKRMPGNHRQTTQQLHAAVKETPVANERIAIIGMSGQFPQSPDLNIYWDNLRNGKDCVTEVPATRWPVEQYFDKDVKAPGKTNSKWMGVLEDADKFDPLFFNISPAEAALMDPQQRVFLENCWHCVEHAGIAPSSLWGARCGVFVGCATGDYGAGDDNMNAQGLMGGSISILSARISYLLNLKGPCLAIETACSSSLVAIASACDSLLLHRCDSALAGGVCILPSPLTHVMTSKAGMLSPTGHCYTFDSRADGFVPGEGAGLVMLKRLSDAARDGDHIYGVIRGWGVNQDGKTNGITAPSMKSQVQLEQEVYDRFRIDPSTISLLEAHGTGTQLGDPIEVEALVNAFKKYTDQTEYCALGAVKSNMGHLLTAAGAASVIKVLLALQHKQLPPTINFRKLNEHISLEGSPFYVNTDLKPWETACGTPRRAAVSAFGFSGTNAHLVIEEYPVNIDIPSTAGPVLFTLSARNEERLIAYAKVLRAAIAPDADAGSIAWTLQTGRDAMEYRLAFIANGIAEVYTRLDAVIEGNADSSVYIGRVKKAREKDALLDTNDDDMASLVETWISKRKLDKIGALWVKGYAIDWKLLYDRTPRRLALPGYPFLRESYWLQSSKTPVQKEALSDVHIFEEYRHPVNILSGELLFFPLLVVLTAKDVAQSDISSWLELAAPGTDVVFVGSETAPEDYLDMFLQIEASHGAINGILYLGGKEEGLERIVPLMQVLPQLTKAPQQVLLSTNADIGSYSAVCMEACKGFQRSLQFVLPDTKVLIATGNETIAALMELFYNSQAESVSWVDGATYAKRLRRIDLPESPGAIRNGATYLITGGAGGLGYKVAKHIATQYTVNLVLTGRSPLDAAKEALLADLQVNGSRAVYLPSDIADERDLRAIARVIAGEFGPLHGIIHAAGIADGRLLHQKSADAFREVLRPKVEGTLLLDAVFAAAPLDFVCYFSSSAAILGDFGSCDYAVGNSFQQHYIDYRRSAGLPGKTVVINWPLWRDGGMHLSGDASTELYLQTSGQRLLESAEGLLMFDRLLAAGEGQYLVLAGDLKRLEQFTGIGKSAVSSITKPVVISRQDSALTSAAIDDQELRILLEADLKQHISELLKIPVTKLDIEENLAGFGFDSISLSALARELSNHFNVNITPALFFAHASIGAVVKYLCSNHAIALKAFYQADAEKVIPKEVHEPVRKADNAKPVFQQKQLQPPVNDRFTDEPIAIIGMSGRFPKARTVDEVWELLKSGKDAIEEIPDYRFDWRTFYGDPLKEPGKTNSKWCGFVPGVGEFDAAFFEISPKEARTIDPRQRLLLQEAWNALEDAGYGEAKVSASRIGMYVGVEEGDFGLISAERGSITATHNGVLAARLGYFLNFKGPVMAINTACSSSLVALHQACLSLRNNECDTAIAAGVNLMLSPEGFIGMGQAGMLSADGVCYAFDKRANGLVPGEAVAVVVLKPLSKAIADGDPVYAQITASGINYDGRSNGITAPNGAAQSTLVGSIYERYNIDARDIGYIVTHGTGTRLGDPVEIQALDEVFRTFGRKGQYCALTSVKSSLGHTFAASGLVSLVSLVKSVGENIIPASLHCEQVSDYVDWANSSFYVNTASRPWPEGLRTGAVSAFGMSGTNAHVVVRQFDACTNTPPVLPAYVIVLSAKTALALQERVKGLLAWLQAGQKSNIDLASLAITLQTGRYHFRHRYAFVTTSLDHLKDTLQQLTIGTYSPDLFRGVLEGVFSPNSVFETDISSLLENAPKMAENAKDYTSIVTRLAAFYSQGYNIKWAALYGGELPERMHLPGYPFARDEYWPGTTSRQRSVLSSGGNQNVPAQGNVLPAASPNCLPLTNAAVEQSIALYNQKVPAQGNVLPAVPANGIPLTNTAVEQSIALYNQEVPAQGNVLPAVPANGLPLTNTAAEQPIALSSVDNQKIPDQGNVLPTASPNGLPFTNAGVVQPPVSPVVVTPESPAHVNAIPQVPVHGLLLNDSSSAQSPASESAIIPGKPGGIILNTIADTGDTPVISATGFERPIPATTDFPHSAGPATLKQVDSLQLEAELAASLAEALCMDEYSIEKDRKFIEMGLDSIVGVEWIRTVNKQYGLNITATKVYDYPTLAEFSAFIAAQLAVVPDMGSEPSARVIPVVPVPPVRQEAAAPVQPPVREQIATVQSLPGREYGLVINGVLQLEELALRSWQVPPPASDEVTVAVMASAINFPDTMCVRGLYPTMPAYPYVPGFEVAGVVTSIGGSVSGIKPGDEVIALAGQQLGCHASHVNVPAANVVRKPAKWTFEEACSLPVVFSTVYYAFELGQLSDGEKVLIQTATGGCGLVAIQLAQLKGCEIFGTSSRSEKLDILRRLGVKHVMNYRGDFDKEIRALTNGAGVDIVLNMLSGDAIQKGINSLGAGGRYLELAIHGLKTSAPLDLSRLLANQAFFSVDLRQLGFRHGFSGSRLLDVMVEMAEAGQIVPIVSRIYPLSRIVEALQYVDKGSHIGKVVVSHRSSEVQDLTDHCIEQMIEHKYRHVSRNNIRQTGAHPGSQARNSQTLPTSSLTEGIAIIGMSGQFPQSPDLDTYWQHLRDGKDCVTEVPASRWPVNMFYDPDPKATGKSTSKWMGVLEDADKFDPLFFNISPAEAEMMDPQQRLFLENCWHCIEHAGIRPGALSGSRCGVFVGVATGDYGQLLGGDGLNAQGLMGGATSILSARISYLLNLNGPSMAIETACSSALVAIADACNNLVLGNADLALAGGVNVIAAPFMHVLTSKAGMLSSTGHCYTFDHRADGFVPGEGVGVILLKRLSDAERDGDQIYGVIRGWGVNQDGKTNGITAPSVKSQRMLEEEVYDKFGIDPSTITMLEAHGTGTQLGDPIEVEALVAAFSKYTHQQGYCALGSVKSNIGHLLTAAGVSSVIKVLLSIQHKQLPPTINFEALNEHIHLEKSPFFINTSLQPWHTQGGPRRAAVSSFGFSGTNAHLVIEEYIQPTRSVQLPPPVLSSLIVLSARSEERLQVYARLLREYVAAKEDLQLHELAYTLQTGRDAMTHRLVVSANSTEKLLLLLDQYLSGKKSPDWVTGQVTRNNPALLWPDEEDDLNGMVMNWLSKGKFRKVATLWVNGLQIDWDILYNNIRPARIALPVYPFARERYWIQQSLIATPVAKGESPSVEVQMLVPVNKPVNNHTASYDQHLVLLCAAPDNIPALPANVACYHIPVATGSVSERYEEYASYVFTLLKDLLQVKATTSTLIQFIYPENETYCQGLHGLLRSAALENPRITGQVISISNWQNLESLVVQSASAAAVDIAAASWTTTDWKPESVNQAAPIWKEGGVYLITGGAGGLGFLFAKEIASQVQPVTIVLTGRRILDNSLEEKIRSIQQPGVIIDYRQTDVTKQERVVSLLNDIRIQYGRLDGILHSAGEKRDNFIIRKSTAEFQSVIAAKVRGTQWLDEASQNMPLDFFVTFSSVAGCFGNAAQTDYAAGNAFMDAYMAQRQRLVIAGKRSGKSLSINWPLWRWGGMQVDTATLDHMQRGGLLPLDTAAGISAFYKAMSLDSTNVLVLCKARLASAPNVPVRQSGTGTSTRALSAKELVGAVSYNMKQLLSTHIRLEAERIDINEPFESYGIDSIMITRLNQSLGEIFGNISRTLFFEYQTLYELSAYLVQAYQETCISWVEAIPEAKMVITAPDIPTRETIQPEQNISISTPVRQASLRSPIAIIGLSGRYPDADTLSDFWNNLATGKESIHEIPTDRWALDEFYVPDQDEAVRRGKSYSKWGGFLKDFAAFDAGFFNLSPREVMGMDPQERLFLEISWEALEDAGYTRELLKAMHQRQVGVFAGITKTGFELYGPALWEQGQAIFPGTSFSSVANRISYILNLQGPSMPVDTMCSSSLTAIHEACEYLLRGDCEMAIAGGVNIYAHPASYVRLSAYGMLSADGHCKSFGAGGTGFVPGEGAGAVILKRLSDAERDGDHIYGVITSSGINHGGRTNGYTVPNPVAQAGLIRRTMDKAGINARTISYIEAHGTGTELGDPIEITGLTQAFRKDTADVQYCAIGAVKSNIGHLEAAAGIAGLTKILLQLRHKQLVPSLHAEQLNPNISFAETPFVVQQTLRAWDRPLLNENKVIKEYPRTAGLSSFGAGGANAHLIVEEYVEEQGPVTRGPSPAIIVLSAANEARLSILISRLINFLQTSGYGDQDLMRIAYTLQTGREAMNVRIAFVAEDITALKNTLISCQQGDMQDVYRATVIKEYSRPVQDLSVTTDLINNKEYEKIAAAWVSGAEVTWRLLYGTAPRRISLPPYPFARDRYWPGDLLKQSDKKVLSTAYTFREVWEPAELSANERIVINTLLVCSADQSVATELQAWTIAQGLTTEVIVMTPDQLRPLSHPVEAVLYYTTSPEDLKSYTEILHLLQHVGDLPKSPGRILLAGDISEHTFARSFIDSWIGYEQSLSLASKSRVLVGGLRDSLITKLFELLFAVKARTTVFEKDLPFVRNVQPVILKEPQVVFRTGGTYLITGGAGGIGYQVAGYLAAKYKANLILTGRTALDEQRKNKIDALSALGGTAIYVQADNSNESDVYRLSRKINNQFGQLHGIIHSAGLNNSIPLTQQTADQFHQVLAPKVSGTLILDKIFSDQPLDFVCYFSSIAALLGDFGGCSYAVANRFQIGYSHQRTATGKSVVINWPLWREGGMQLDSTSAQAYLQQSGQRLIESDEALQLMEQLIGQPGGQYIVMAGEQDQVSHLLGITGNTKAGFAQAHNANEIDKLIKHAIGRILLTDPHQVHTQLHFSEMGFDSISLSALAKELSSHFGITLTTSTFFTYPTVQELVDYLSPSLTNDEQLDTLLAKVKDGSLDIDQADKLLFQL